MLEQRGIGDQRDLTLAHPAARRRAVGEKGAVGRLGIGDGDRAGQRQRRLLGQQQARRAAQWLSDELAAIGGKAVSAIELAAVLAIVGGIAIVALAGRSEEGAPSSSVARSTIDEGSARRPAPI